MRDVACALMGGGLAGSMAALELARAGREVVLLEKSRGAHDKVCGEFLSRESVHYLQRHGVDLGLLGGVPIRSVRLIARTVLQEVDLPFKAFSLTRRTLDEEMLRLAVLAGAGVCRGAFVDGLERIGDAWSVGVRDGDALRARDVFLATGKHDVRRWARPAGTHTGLVGFKMYYRLTAQQHSALGHAVELILFPGGYAGLQPVEDGVANLCLLVRADRLREAGADWPGLLRHLLEHSSHLAERLEGATALLDAPLAAAKIPYGHVQRSTERALWRVGDQAAVVPSFCGDGMAIALHSGALASSYMLRGESAMQYQCALHRQLAPRIWMATKLSQMLVGAPRVAQVARLFPALLSDIALMTRIPDRALLTASVFRD